MGLGVDESGQVYRNQNGNWEVYAFNSIHKDYYPQCRFTYVQWTGELFYLAGMDNEGVPHLFTSLMGGVWEERNLTMRLPGSPEVKPESEICCILYEEGERQVFALCRSGQLIVLPDCPKCVKIRRLSGLVEDAILEEGTLVIRFVGGAEERIPVWQAAQRRVSHSFAREQMLHGGVLVDLRDPQEIQQSPIPETVSVPWEDVDLWLERQEKHRPIIFLCRSGIRADQATAYARRQGFTRAYSLGATLEGIQMP